MSEWRITEEKVRNIKNEQQFKIYLYKMIIELDEIEKENEKIKIELKQLSEEIDLKQKNFKKNIEAIFFILLTIFIFALLS